MIKILNCFHSKKTVASDPNESSKTADKPQTNGVAFAKDKSQGTLLKKLLSIIRNIFRKLLCGFSCLKENSSLEKKDASPGNITFPIKTITSKDLLT